MCMNMTNYILHFMKFLVIRALPQDRRPIGIRFVRLSVNTLVGSDTITRVILNVQL